MDYICKITFSLSNRCYFINRVAMKKYVFLLREHICLRIFFFLTEIIIRNPCWSNGVATMFFFIESFSLNSLNFDKQFYFIRDIQRVYPVLEQFENRENNYIATKLIALSLRSPIILRLNVNNHIVCVFYTSQCYFLSTAFPPEIRHDKNRIPMTVYDSRFENDSFYTTIVFSGRLPSG